MRSVLTRRRRVREVAERREAEYEAYEQSELLDELTDQSERMARPMENGFVYSFGKNGKLYSEYGDQLEEVFASGLELAERLALNDPENWGFEAARRRIEQAEIQRLQQLKDGEKLITFSPIPDAVREGLTNIGGYDRERQKMLVRIGERRGNEVAIFSFSLDGSNYKAMQAAARTVGGEIPDGMKSEEVLANSFHLDSEHPFNLKDCRELIRAAYDLEMERQFGGKWYAGRPELRQEDALSFIKKQLDLVAEHMKVIKAIKSKGLDEDTRDELLERARYNLAAALDDRLQGKEVTSLESAGEGARQEGKSFDGDCPPGGSKTDGQVQQLGFMQGQTEEKKFMTCPYCGLRTFSEVCDPVCDKCGSTPGNDKTGGTGRIETIWDKILRWHEESKMMDRAKEKTKRAKNFGKRILGLRSNA